jgi:hypothetical protein
VQRGDSYLVIDHQGNIAKCQMEIERPITSIYADAPLALPRADRQGIQNLSVGAYRLNQIIYSPSHLRHRQPRVMALTSKCPRRNAATRLG